MISLEKRFAVSAILIAGMMASWTSCSSPSDSHEHATQPPQKVVRTTETQTIVIDQGGTKMNCYAAYGSDSARLKPVVLVVPEWWGLNDYAKSRVRQLADSGYVALAVDMYGGGRIAENPRDAGKEAGAFYSNPQLALGRIQAALQQALILPGADSARTAAIGYCFGGAMVLNAAKLGLRVKAVISFHGNLKGVPPSKEKTQAAILVLHGAADSFVPEGEVNSFKSEMNRADIPYTFITYPGATHAFTNPDATETGRKFSLPIAYSPSADTASWRDMQSFLVNIFK